jgi:hypothetical protein
MKRLLIPLFFMLLAALACDQPYYDLPRIMGIHASAETAGTVYALVGNSEAQSRYVSTDYGRTWQPTTEEFETSTGNGYSMEGDTLFFEGSPIWSFPRPTFRFFFLDDEYRQHFALPTWERVTTSEANGVLYVGMGSEGVLTFTAPGEWHLSAVGIEQLDPIPLIITDPPTLASIVALGLLVPPLALLHAYLLTRVWLYALTARHAWRAALAVTGIITLLAAVAIVIWLTDSRTDYYPIVAIMTVVTVVLSVGAALLVIPQPHARRIAWRTATIALIVPAGVVSIWWGWLIIVPLLVGYSVYRYAYARVLKSVEQATPGAVDRWALKSTALTTFYAAALLFVGVAVGRGGVFVFIIWLVGAYFLLRLFLDNVEKIMRRDYEGEISFRRTISLATVAAYILAPILAVAVFSGQSYAYNWFTTLLVSG